MNDEFIVGHGLLAFAYIVAGMNAEAVVEAKKILSLSTEANDVAIAATALAEVGRKEEAVAILNRLLRERDTHYVDPFDIGMIYAALRDEANTLEWLERAVNEKSTGIPRATDLPMFVFLQDNPRFREISTKLGLR